MNILVTGGAGYIGSTVAQQLLEAGHRVTVYDNLSSGHRAAVPAAARFVRGDTLERAALDQVLGSEAFDAILHFAAFIEAGESMREPGRFFRNNVTGALTLIDAAIAHGVPRFVFSSTAGVYASKDGPLVETDPVGPSSVYGATKYMVEQALEWYHRIHGLRVAILRYFNAAGAAGPRGEAHQPETHLIPLVLQVALGQRASIAVFGDDYPTPDGSCVRDYIHIEDLATAHVLALHGLDQRPFMRYNLGNGAGYSVLEVIESARRVTGHAIPAVIQPRRPGDPAILIAGSARIQDELGWQPQHPDLAEIIASAWQWHVENPARYGDEGS
ncbi:MAG TPA: UDP-glucose 4-epimerase GalE [Anaerolineae bacterium]|nr:UDP-glucose 4-epimerase GalE [Anaerolineae bacterium]HNU05826.1 UDP-glucose 4-epimerase GalE [Anaerolineae bacterium]